ncbi:V-type ATP synthase subunit F [Streptococcus sp. DD11]|uniref:V-type ATP synthase subunit F n=1 Tax=Streptococcus sp. DD11 TaxID=1777879 RepID=UPI00079AAE46|nr:V-type ATP synthase subunit F [Streptococcus sp. DD11]KXT77549.1 V-type ATP synthase subunit F [Streptococcus sp. DD11]
MDKTSYQIAVVGSRDAILPFKLIGFQTFPVSQSQEAVKALRQLARDRFGIIYLTEDIAAQIPETLAYYDKQELPAITLIPTHRGSSGLGRQRIRDNVEKAVGQDIL